LRHDAESRKSVGHTWRVYQGEPPVMNFGASILLICRSSFPTDT